MRLKHIEIGCKEPTFIDNSILRCYVYEPFRIQVGETVEAYLGFLLDIEGLTRVIVNATRNDNMLCYHFNLEKMLVKIINFSLVDDYLDRGEHLCDLHFCLALTLKSAHFFDNKKVK